MAYLFPWEKTVINPDHAGPPLGLRTVAKWLDLSPREVRKLVQEGKLVGVHRSGRYQFERSAFWDYFRKKRNGEL